MDDGGQDSAFSLHRVFSSELDGSYAWYAVTSAMAEGKITEFANSDVFKFFRDEIVEISRDKLTDEQGARVCFGNRKRDSLFVCTLFGLLARSLRRKNLEKDLFLNSKEFDVLKEQLKRENFFLAGENGAIFETPPTTPEDVGRNEFKINAPEREVDRFCSTKEFMQELKNGKFSERKKAKRDGFLAKSLRASITRITEEYSSEDLGLVLGKSLILGGKMEKDFSKEIFSTVVDVVQQSKGMKNGLELVLGPDVLHSLYDQFRVPDWQQLYVKLLTKLPDKAWQTVINFLHTGQTGVSTSRNISKC